MQFHPITWGVSKMNLRKEVISKLKVDQSDLLKIMLKQWWHPATRKGLQKMIENLKSKSA